MVVRDRDEFQTVPIEKVYRRESADITVKCPICGLEYTEYDNYDDEWHFLECDRCGKKYKYKYNWM